ncbi:MAG: sugar phosphate isomerase/epimerase family protein [Thermodesulfobacteriota bacterium]
MLISLFSQSLFCLNLEDAIKMTAEGGFDAIEIACAKPHLALEDVPNKGAVLKKLLKNVGLKVSALSTYTNLTSTETLNSNIKMLINFIELASEFETNIVKITPGPPSSKAAKEVHWLNIRKALEQCLPDAEKEGIKLAVETHLNMLTDTTGSTMKLLSLFDSPALGVNLDFCNLYLGGDDPADSIKKLRDKLYFTHVKDVRCGPDRCWVPLGQGELNYRSIIKALSEVGYSGYLSIECLYDEVKQQPRKFVSADLLYLRELLEELT